MRRALIVIFMLLVFGVALALVVENLRSVEFDFLFGRLSLPLAAVLAAALALGAVVGFLVSLPAALAARSRTRRLARKLREAEQEIGNLRRAPLRDAH